jgi:ankyrin repeat protein
LAWSSHEIDEFDMLWQPWNRVLLALLLAVAFVNGAHGAPLDSAAVAGDVNEVRRLLDDGADANGGGAGTPLYFAAQRGHADVVALLVERGADVNTVTQFGTALQIAARGNQTAIMEMLLRNGADPNLSGGEYGNTPLHDAAERGAIEAARLLLENGADVNSRTKRGHPPIHLATSKGKDEMVALLLEHGAAPMPVEPLAPGELAAADPEEGRLRAEECRGCHALEPGTKPSGPYPGPDLWNVVGRDKGSVPGYDYSRALGGHEGIWTYEELNRFLADPTGYVPGTNMQVEFEPDRSKRIPLIAYLRNLSDNPLPLE